MSSRGLVIGWMPISRRSATIARALGYQLRIMPRRGMGRPWTAPLAYPVSALRSAWILLRHRPRSVVVVAPPVFAPLCVVPIARLLGARVVVDIHSGAMLDPRWRWSVPLLAWAARQGFATVTLESLAGRLSELRVRSLVLPDPLPSIDESPISEAATSLPAAGTDPGNERPRVVAICGWGVDEPVEALISAARGATWDLAITGRPRRRLELPSNVTLTGFLDEASYVALLRSASLVVALTERNETLLSGAWEALALKRPFVVSATATLREAFGPEVACLGASAHDMRRGIDTALGRLPEQTALAASLADRFSRANEVALQSLSSALEEDR